MTMTVPGHTDLEALAQQGRSLISTRRAGHAHHEAPPLYAHHWPPVAAFDGSDHELARFVASSRDEQLAMLAARRGDREEHGRMLHGHLGALYADCYGYPDSPFATVVDDDAELHRFAARVVLERELMEHWFDTVPPPRAATNQVLVADELDRLAADNAGVRHPLFAFLRDHATRAQIERFLECDLIRNEVVDDEVALLVIGLQGMQKAVAAANLWDECGRGRLENFHTYWLRRLLEFSAGWDRLLSYRHDHPWFAKMTSNLLTALLTRPGRKQMAYGCFLVFESWVEPHFRAVLDGMRRVGLTDPDLTIYFAAHVAIDPRHSGELSDALRLQRPALTPRELGEIVYGANLAVSAGTGQFDRLLEHLKCLPDRGPDGCWAP